MTSVETQRPAAGRQRNHRAGPMAAGKPSKKSSKTVRGDSKPSDQGTGRVPPPRRLPRIAFWLLAGTILGAAGTIGWALYEGRQETPVTGSVTPAKYAPDRAMRYMIDLCNFGPRPSGSAAMARQQDYLQSFFESQGAVVQRQSFEVRHPETGGPTPITNLIASWGMDRPNRYLLCAHYDTRPYPDQDPHNKRGVFIGANDGASGTAALMELSHHLTDLPESVGVDIVLFDGEELVFQQGRDDYFLGSTYFANQYLNQPPVSRYESGILLDMIGDRELKIYYERNSLDYAPDLVREVWKVARRLKVREFVPRVRHTISDDHLPLNRIAKIPTIDLIDFDYPRPGFGAPSYWHTEKDIPENCSGESLALVVWVVHDWLKQKGR